MKEVLEGRLVEALEKVDVIGYIAPMHLHDPMTMALRSVAIQSNLMIWDGFVGRYVLTATGRHRIKARAQAYGSVLRFTKHDRKRDDGKASADDLRSGNNK